MITSNQANLKNSDELTNINRHSVTNSIIKRRRIFIASQYIPTTFRGY